ncbi:MarR family winged helix-turn-helix transcriptional regulator [Humibacillus xanthopallidus]|uniref:DNA-binding MarR family transcriptional regulator n=1 Tax=Humibacillus xanthopallidus TaxID=412689 RepID=A0A543H9R9_9MICO|nr:MarR family transcriptional regulator [Humibacillus xanthopallidus]TQM55074.1 DNA-binding MarR family transcriptional regulator [Humibacillus xanthopallidus]
MEGPSSSGASGRPPHAPETVALRDLATAGSEASTALARRMTMHPTDLAAMSHIAYAAEQLGPGELSSRLGITPAATTDLIDRLEAAGHLLRERNPADRRRVRLVPTESAKAAVRGQLADLLERLDAVSEDFTPSERAAIQRYLEAAAAAYRAFAQDS